MKLKHVQTQFLFTDGEIKYHVVCAAAKHQENVFVFFKDGERIGSRSPQGGHVNKTSAQNQLRLFLTNQP